MIDDDIKNRRTALGWLVGGGIVAAASLAEDQTCAAEESVPLNKLPKAIKDAAERILPKGTWHTVVKVVDEKNIAYELDGSDGKDRDVTVMVTAQGKVVEVETQLKKPANVPAKVLATVQAKWPKFTPTETHEIRQGKDLQGLKDGDYVYDMRGTIAKGRDIQVQLTADGEILESTVELPLDKVPAVVTAALKKAKPNFEIEAAYAIREADKLIGYHFEVKGPKGRDRTISVTPDGTQVEIVE